MPDLPAGVFVRLDRISTVSLAAHAEASPLIGPLSLGGDVLTVVCLGRE